MLMVLIIRKKGASLQEAPDTFNFMDEK